MGRIEGGIENRGMVWGMEAFIWHQQQVQIRSNWPGRGANVTPNPAFQTTVASPTFGTTRHTHSPEQLRLVDARIQRKPQQELYQCNVLTVG